MDYSIGEFSKLIGISAFTLRYYEKEELIATKRKKNGRRVYSEDDINWIEFIKRLKDTGMPIKEINKYAKLRAMGKSTMNERMDMLIKHRFVLKEEIEKLQEHLIKLDGKIDFYKDEIDKEENN
ncbi:MerR family transcriptional regulator [Clostridium guangxiense]|uniref:MerR family transcriptional regulator n=1 Tax=Clostridium guangxiense TaxID=1662055 RepID=UPI001E648F2C|nr:MerR family transcriptional regulator [Clostridium guangxiense]MCD2346922.1 MerR family transcriptional regulator [Clostridium guangxiense]